MKEFHLEIVTPDGQLYDGMVESLLVHSVEGNVEFLAGHIDYIASLDTGKARLRVKGKDIFASVSGGFVSITNGEAKLVAITFEFAEDIDVERAKLAKERANEVISSSKDAKNIDLAKHKLQRALTRIKVSELK